MVEEYGKSPAIYKNIPYPNPKEIFAKLDALNRKLDLALKEILELKKGLGLSK